MYIQNPKYKLIYAEFTEDEGQKAVTIYGSESGIPDPANDEIVNDSDIPLGYKLVYYKDGALYGSESGIPAVGDEAIDTGNLFVDASTAIISIAVDTTETITEYTFKGDPENYDFSGLIVTATFANGLTATLDAEEYNLDPEDGSEVPYNDVPLNSTVVFTVTVTAGDCGAKTTFNVTVSHPEIPK